MKVNTIVFFLLVLLSSTLVISAADNRLDLSSNHQVLGFDASHEWREPFADSDENSLFENLEGYEVIQSEGEFTLSYLESISTLLIPNSDASYTSEELSLIDSFVQNGGNLLILGESGNFIGDGTDTLLDYFGIVTGEGVIGNGGTIFDDTHKIGLSGQFHYTGDSIQDHPLTNGVSSILTLYGGYINSAPDNFENLIVSDQDANPSEAVAGGIMTYGEGEIFVHLDSTLLIHTTSYDLKDTVKYGQNVLNHLLDIQVDNDDESTDGMSLNFLFLTLPVILVVGIRIFKKQN